MPRLCFASLALVLAALALPDAAVAQKEFGFDNRKPSGQEYISAEESVKRFKVLDGWEAFVFAAEPDVVNPIAFTVDEKGRLWVVECFEYPSRTPKGKKPRDRIRIIEDTDGDGKADKSTIWADGKDLPISFDMASGIEVGHGGVFLGAPPYLFFLSDPDKTGKCTKQEILLKGFGSQDTHETLNTFQWGPDGRLYGLHGIFTNSEVEGVKINGAVWRYDVHTKKFEMFAEGTSNPWGMDFDRNGQCFLACCVIPHLFHIVPGGTYKRQAGASFNPYAYGLLNEICDHTHHKLSGWAHAGLIVLEGEHIPKELKGSLVMGSIHGCSLKRNTLRPNGSTYIGSSAPDFLVSGDKNMRPINLRWAPDGSIYLIDWHDQNPCHQALPDSWDKERGRIYRLAPKGLKTAKAEDLSKKTHKELVELLDRENPYWYRTALRLLAERRESVDRAARKIILDRAVGKDATHSLRAMWALNAVGSLDALGRGVAHEDPWVRAWDIRFVGESPKLRGKLVENLTKFAEKEPAPQVRLELASLCQRRRDLDTLPVLHALMKHKEDKKDPYLPLMIWLAYEPQVIGKRPEVLDWLKDNAPDNALVTDEIVPRTMRRLVATGKTEDLAAAVAFLGEVKDHQVRRRALDGLLAGLKTPVDPPPSWAKVQAILAKDDDPAIADLSGRLALMFQDKAAVARAIDTARDRKLTEARRLAAIRDLGALKTKPKDAYALLINLVHGDDTTDIRVAAARALGGSTDGPDLAKVFLADWKKLPPPVRAEAVTILSSQKAWAKELLASLGKGTVSRSELNDNTILRILGFKDKALDAQVEKTWGKFRDSPKELAALIDKMRGEMHIGTASFERGRKVFETQCAKCHRFEGKGFTVGPELDGAARDMEYLLGNVLDPNRVIGSPYLLRLLETKAGVIETGLLHGEDETSITLKVENDVLKTFKFKDIEGKVRVLDKSMMPEGLASTMTVQDLRDLIKYVMAHPFITAGEVELEGTRKTFHTGPAGRIPLPDLPAVIDKTAAIHAQVIAPEAMHGRLQIFTKHAGHVYANDKLAHSWLAADPKLPDMRVIELDVPLEKGMNRLRVDVQYRGAAQPVQVRFLDAERKLRYGE